MKLNNDSRIRLTDFLKRITTNPPSDFKIVKEVIETILEQEDSKVQKALSELDHANPEVTKDNLASIWVLGNCYYCGIGVVRNEAKAFKWFEAAAKLGYADAQCSLGFCYANGLGVNKDVKKAVEWSERAAKQGHAEAQYYLGVSYVYGLGGNKDEKEAVRWFEAAAKLGYADAQCSLGFCYANGLGVNKDVKKAVEWSECAAKQGHAEAQYNLGVSYQNGRGVKKDEKEAARWYGRAAKLGYADAQFNLGGCYALGEGIDKDWKKVAEWFEAAAKQGHAKAQFYLGVCYANGRGVNKDEKKSEEFCIQALRQSEFVEIHANDTKEIILNKLFTSLLYHAKRYAWDTYPCKQIRNYIILLEKKYKDYSKQQFEKMILEIEEREKTFYGSYLSDDSDSDAETEYQKMSAEKRKAVESCSIGTVKLSMNKIPSKRQNIQRPKALDEKIKKDLETLNKMISDGESISEAVKGITTKFYVAQYRGVTYLTTKWNKSLRQAHRREDEAGKPQYSASVLLGATNAKTFLEANKLKKEMSAAQLQKFEENCEKWARLLKDKLISLRNSKRFQYKKRTYDNLGDLLQNIYSRNYDGFERLLKNGIPLKHYLLNEYIPFVSTGDVPDHALRYAYGTKPYKGHQDERLRPRWQKSGRAERPHSGKVYISIHPLTDFDKKDGPSHVVSENTAGNVVLNCHIISERESTFPAWIEPKRVVAQHIAKYPSFHGNYKDVYLKKYGLTEERYNDFKKMWKEAPPHTPQMKQFKKELGEHLCSYYEVKLIEIARQKVEKPLNQNGLGGILIYRNAKGGFSFDLPLDTTMRNNKKIDEQDKAATAAAREYFKTLSKDDSEVQQLKTFDDVKTENSKLAKSPTKYAELSDLIAAIERKNVNEVKKLKLISINYIAPYFKDNKMTTPLHQAVSIGAIDIVEHLLGKGACTDIRDYNGDTPAHIAARLTSIPMIQLLKLRGANLNILNNKNETPKDIARLTNNSALEDYMLTDEERQHKMQLVMERLAQAQVQLQVHRLQQQLEGVTLKTDSPKQPAAPSNDRDNIKQKKENQHIADIELTPSALIFSEDMIAAGSQSAFDTGAAAGAAGPSQPQHFYAAWAAGVNPGGFGQVQGLQPMNSPGAAGGVARPPQQYYLYDAWAAGVNPGSFGQGQGLQPMNFSGAAGGAATPPHLRPLSNAAFVSAEAPPVVTPPAAAAGAGAGRAAAAPNTNSGNRVNGWQQPPK